VLKFTAVLLLRLVVLVIEHCCYCQNGIGIVSRREYELCSFVCSRLQLITTLSIVHTTIFQCWLDSTDCLLYDWLIYSIDAGIRLSLCLTASYIITHYYYYYCNSNCITGCTVAQHCCKGDQPFQWENPKFDPSVNPKPLNFFTSITSSISSDMQNLVKICSPGTSSWIGEI